MRHHLALAFVFAAPLGASAQVGVQQPVVATTAVSTTVSVPDRGSAFLGGVSSAQSARAQYGPLRSGTSLGLSRQATSISTSVVIHDLQAMDEAILNSGPSQLPVVRVPNDHPSWIASQQSQPKVPTESAADKARKFERLAQRADDAGKKSLAKLHWQAAARHGSQIARIRLADSSSESDKILALKQTTE